MTLLRDNPPEALELWNKETGETAPVVPDLRYWPEVNGRYFILGEPSDCGDFFHGDGAPVSSYTYPNWIIRLKQGDALAALRAEFDAYKREVSDAVNDTKFMIETHCDTEALALVSNRLNRFILHEPVDPLVDALRASDPDGAVEDWDYAPQAEALKAELAKRGLKIVEDDQ